MPSPAARRLSEAHRRTQLGLGTQTVERLRVVWPLLDPGDLDGTFARWLAAALPIIGAQRSASARLAAAYLRTFKALEVGLGPRPPTVLAENAPTEAATTSLMVTGPLSVKRAMTRGLDTGRAMSTAEAASSAAGMRHALNGGRETILGSVRSDPQAVGFQRVASGNACAFCDLLAGRGGVYGADTADFQAHDGCSCTAEPAYG